MRGAKRTTRSVLTKTGDASFTLFSSQYSQTYHSSFGAINESTHVFLHGSGVHARIQAGMRTHILEIGFGLGLNCLLCADYAEKHATSLSYTGIEHSPIAAATFLKLGYKDKLIHPSLANQLSAVFSDSENWANTQI